MARNSEQVLKEIKRITNQKYGITPFEQCLTIWQLFNKGMFGQEIKDEFPREYEIVYNVFRNNGMNNVQLSTLQFLDAFISSGKLVSLTHHALEYTIGQTCSENVCSEILKAIEDMHEPEKLDFIEKANQRYNDLFDYSKGFFIGMDVPMEIECKRCNNKMNQKPVLHLTAKHPCISCAIHVESWEPSDNEPKSEHWAHVFNGLYISDIFGAHNVSWVQSNNFGGIIDLSNSSNLTKYPNRIDVMHVPVDDNVHAKLTPYFKRTFEFIASHLDKREKVLVFCRAGISRSATIVVYYLMRAFSLTVDDAVAFLKKKRAQIQPNNGFMKQLREQYKADLELK